MKHLGKASDHLYQILGGRKVGVTCKVIIFTLSLGLFLVCSFDI